MSDWKNVDLGDHIDLFTGFPFKSSHYSQQGLGTKLLRGDNIQQGFLKWENVKLWEKIDNIHKSYLLNENDIILAMDRPWIEAGLKYAMISAYDLPCLLVQRVACLRAKKTLSQRFLKYVISSKNFTEYVRSIETGTAVPHISGQQIKEYTLSIPKLAEQKAIASVLSSLDDKIDLLHRQNKTLESMAETLFRQWFVEEAQDDWPLVLLGEFINCINGASYKSTELSDSNNALITLKNFSRDGSFRKDGFKEFIGKYKEKQVVVENDIVVAHTDLTQDASLIGNPIFIQNVSGHEKLIISMDLVKVELTSDLLSKSYLFNLLKSSDFKDYAISCSNGSSVIHLSKKALPNYAFKLPTKDIIDNYSAIADNFYKKTSCNFKQIQILEKLRDTLLPKLMSGEVRVQYAEEAIAAVK